MSTNNGIMNTGSIKGNLTNTVTLVSNDIPQHSKTQELQNLIDILQKEVQQHSDSLKDLNTIKVRLDNTKTELSLPKPNKELLECQLTLLQKSVAFVPFLLEKALLAKSLLEQIGLT